jgi:bifunctional DNA-binding transcriptional regulator/antitoxin component of YhaV-PrlF toxin-antitoxin module
MKFIDSSKVASNIRITVTKAVQEILGEVKPGDMIMFYEDDRGNVVIKKA